ncbi:MAG: class I SAM-dependent methyltransferase [Flavobacteriales bacterium]
MLRSLLRALLNERQRQLLGRRLHHLRAWPLRKDLNALALHYGTDKWGRHYYTQHYQVLLGPLRTRPLRMLEIGVGGYTDPRAGGGSLRMWKRYFPKARITALDLYDKSWWEEPRIRIHQGSQTDIAVLDRIVKEDGPFDLIIDDGSHVSTHIIATFEHLFPSLKDGGHYIIEDTQTSYWKEFGGDEHDRTGTHTSMGYFKSLVDGLNHEEIRDPARQEGPFDRSIRSIHFHHNLVVICKGSNEEGSNLGPQRISQPRVSHA